MSSIETFLKESQRLKIPTVANNPSYALENGLLPDEAPESLTSRPQRWDVPFGNMDEEAVERLMYVEPFASMNERRFTHACPLRKILLNDTRIVNYEAGDVIVREGDYGHSAFMVLSGEVQVTLDSLPKRILGQDPGPTKTSWQAIAQLWTNSRHRESRLKARASDDHVGVREVDGESRIFLQDVPGILNDHRTLQLNNGEFFGELAALSRTPRTATVFAQTASTLLEIRWQGLRDLMRRDEALQQHIHKLYRQNSLESHLRETPFLRHLSADDIRLIAAETEFETHGDFEWNREFKKNSNADPNEQINAEPIISEEGHYADGVLLMRTGFARVSRRWGDGHRTLSYLGKGQVYGLAELAFSAVKRSEIPLQNSLRALGYVDALRIPSRIVQQLIVPSLPKRQRNELVQQVEWEMDVRQINKPTNKAPTNSEIDPGLMEFIAEHRLMNGTATMIIDLDRCVRCDDCVKACASTHDNNPRFIRNGPTYGSYQFPNACMHCVDPVCLIGCPTGAIAREPQHGNILINDNTCVGCGTCAESCPYSNIRMVEITDQKGRPFFDEQSKLPILKATKCDFCETQLGGPACQRACSHDALIRIDMQDTKALNSWVSR